MSGKAAESKSKSKARYCVKKGENLPDAFRRVLSEQLTQAVEVLSAHEGSLEEPVHEARRCIKRVRSVLRLIKPAIPNTYASENRRLRDVGRSLSELRDSHALLQTLMELEEEAKERQSEESGQRAFADAHTFLENRGQQIAQTMGEGGIDDSISRLRQALSRIEKLRYVKVNPRGISKSIYRTVKRGRKAFAAAENDGDSEQFHQWRKRAKDLRYQLSLLSDLRPELRVYAESAKELEQRLGDDHNLAVLSALLSGTQTSGGDELESLRKEIARRQSVLRDQAMEIGKNLYGEKRKFWKHRVAAASMEV